MPGIRVQRVNTLLGKTVIGQQPHQLIYLFVPGVFTGTNMIAVLYLHDLSFGAAQTGALMLSWAATVSATAFSPPRC
jgi:hypothetical protein